jgi:hypothetical protein
MTNNKWGKIFGSAAESEHSKMAAGAIPSPDSYISVMLQGTEM